MTLTVVTAEPLREPVTSDSVSLLEEMLSVLSLLAPLKALLPMLVSAVPVMSVLSFFAPAKALAPMVLTLAILSVARRLQFLKALAFTAVALPAFTWTSLVQLANA